MEQRRGEGGVPGALPGILLIAAVGALCVYRALTQAVTHDEALTWQWYATGDMWRAFAPYNPNNHVLHTLLVRPSVALLGSNELGLRLPAMLGMALYLVTARRLCRLAFGNGALGLLGLGLLALNPLVLDFLVAARGYSLAMGFFLWGLLCLLRWLGAERRDGLALRASLAFGLATVSHLTFALPSLAVATVALVWGAADRGRRLGPSLARLAVPGILLAGALWSPSLLRAGSIRYDYGRASLLETAVDLAQRSFAHHETSWPVDTGGGAFASVVALAAWLAGPALVLLALVGLGVLRRRPRAASARVPAERLAVLAGGALLLCVALLWAAHLTIGALYPTDRWGLYLVLLGTLSAVAALAVLRAAGGWRGLAAAAGGLVLCAALLQYVVQLQTTHFAVWRLDAGARRFVELVAARESGRPPHPVRLEAMHWRLVPSLNFYRRALGLAEVAEVPHDWDADGPPPDYLVVVAALYTPAIRARFEIIDTDTVSGTSLAVPR